MNPVRYVLEVRRPDNYGEVWAFFEAATPWGAIHVGDIVDPGSWPGSQSPRRVLRVLRVEHAVFDEGSHLTHLLRLATEEVDGYPRVESTLRSFDEAAEPAPELHPSASAPDACYYYLPGGLSPVGEGPGGRPPGGPPVTGCGPGGRPPGGPFVVGCGPGGRPPGGPPVVGPGPGGGAGGVTPGNGSGKPPGGKNPPGGGGGGAAAVGGGPTKTGGSAGGMMVGAMVGATVGATVGAITTWGGGGGGGGGWSSTDRTTHPPSATKKNAHPVTTLADLARFPMMDSSAPAPPRLLP